MTRFDVQQGKVVGGAVPAPSPAPAEPDMRAVVAVAVTMLYESHPDDVLRTFTIAELDEIVRITEAMGSEQVEAIYKRAWDALSATTSGAADLPEPHFGEGRYLGLAFRSDAYSVAQVQALFASRGQSPSPQAAQQPAQSAAAASDDCLWNPLPCVHCERSQGEHFVGRCYSVSGKTVYTPQPTAQADSVTAPAGGAAILKEILAAACCEDSETYLTNDQQQKLYDLQRRIESMPTPPTQPAPVPDEAIAIDRTRDLASNGGRWPSDWVEAYRRGYSDRAARAPADSVLEDAARLEFEMQHGSAIAAARKQGATQ